MKTCKHCGSPKNNGPCWENDYRFGHGPGEVACSPCYEQLKLQRCLDLGDTGIGKDSNGKLFIFDTEPLPLLNPGLYAGHEKAGEHTTDTGWHFAVDQDYDTGKWFYNACYPSYRTGDPIGPFETSTDAYNHAMDLVSA